MADTITCHRLQQYALHVTDWWQTNERTDGQCHCVKLPLWGVNLITQPSIPQNRAYSKSHTVTTNGLRHGTQCGVPIRELVGIVGIRVRWNSTCHVVARILASLTLAWQRFTPWHAVWCAKNERRMSEDAWGCGSGKIMRAMSWQSF